MARANLDRHAAHSVTALPRRHGHWLTQASLLDGRGLALFKSLAIVLAMSSAAEHMPLADVKNKLSEVVDRLAREHGRVVITKHGRPAAVVLSVDDLEGLEETLELLSDPRAMRRIRKAEAEIAAGEAAELTKEQALALARRS
jgi:antitoxin YefM